MKKSNIPFEVVKIKMIFKNRYNPKEKLGERTFDINSISMMRGYQHNYYTVWGYTTENKRKNIKNCQLEIKDNKIIVTKNN